MSDPRQGWQDALAPAPECIDVARFGEELDPASRAHLESCVRCQSELALYRELQEVGSGEEAAAGQWIAGELQRRFQEPGNVVPFRAKWPRALFAAAAAIVMVIGAAWWMQMREPSLDPELDGPAIYRSTRLDVIAPVGDLAQPPNELRWNAVPHASRYQVQILEVDATPVWSAGTRQPVIALPPAVIARFAPGKSLLWDVKAYRGDEMLASSDTQTVRVSVTPLKKDP